MSVITSTSLNRFKDSDNIIEFISSNRYNPENENLLESEEFNALPDYAKFVIFILDFETEYEMQGILTTIENSVGQYLPQIAESFNNTQNIEIASLIYKIIAVLNRFSVPLKNDTKHYDNISSDIFGNEEFIENINKIDEKLEPLILEKEFWCNVVIFIDNL